MENLINAALADGVLTEKEKQVLFKRAQAMGIDLDEFEMVLDARLVELKKKEAREEKQHELEMEKAKAAQKSAPKSNKYGDVRKCPACGAMIGAFTTVCPECGHEFVNVEANSTTKKLQETLEEIDRNNSSLFGGVTRFFGADGATMKKVQAIQNFAIPNTKEDLLEFLTLCYSNSYSKQGDTMSDTKITEAWRNKSVQVLEKSKLMLKDVPEAQDIMTKLGKDIKRRKINKMLITVLPLALALFLVGGITIWGMKSCSDSDKAKVEAVANMKSMSQDIDKYLAAGNIDAAANELTNCTDDISSEETGNMFRSLLTKVVSAYREAGDYDKAKSLFMTCLQKIPEWDKNKLKELATEVGVELSEQETPSIEMSSTPTSGLTKDQVDDLIKEYKSAVKDFKKAAKKASKGDVDAVRDATTAYEKIKYIDSQMEKGTKTEKQQKKYDKIQLDLIEAQGYFNPEQ